MIPRFKIGEYVRSGHTGAICKVMDVNNSGFVRVCPKPEGQGADYGPANEFERLGLQLKPFDFSCCVCESRNIKGSGRWNFRLDEKGPEVIAKIFSSGTAWWEDNSPSIIKKSFTTSQEACAWLELQYVEMLMKAREERT